MQKRLWTVGVFLLFFIFSSIPLTVSAAPTPITIYGAWHCGNDACIWGTVRDITEFDSKNHWLIDRGNGSGLPSVNLLGRRPSSGTPSGCVLIVYHLAASCAATVPAAKREGRVKTVPRCQTLGASEVISCLSTARATAAGPSEHRLGHLGGRGMPSA